MDAAGFDRRLRWADVVLTGEGAVDRTSLEGKVLAGVLRRAGRLRKPVLVIAGRWGAGAGAVRRRAQGSALAAPGLSARDSMRRARLFLPGAARALLKGWAMRL
jgi:glycerate kinase